MRVTLEFRCAGRAGIDVRELTPGRVLAATQKELLRKPLPVGNDRPALGEACRIFQEPGGPDELVLRGETARLQYAGWKMDGGRLIVDGDAGRWAGAEMRAGELEIRGDAGLCLGVAMTGGLIRCAGSAGDYAGAAHPGRKDGVSGGTILVHGNAGREAGAGMRRGLLVVGGSAGEFSGAEMLAGSIFVMGELERNAGLNLKRGSILAGRLKGGLPAGFRSAGPGDGLWVSLYARRIRDWGLRVDAEWLSAPWLRFSGDHTSAGKGELYVHEFVE